MLGEECRFKDHVSHHHRLNTLAQRNTWILVRHEYDVLLDYLKNIFFSESLMLY